MSVDVLMPKLGFSMNEADLQEWVVADGGQVTEKETLFIIESEKSAHEIEAPASGKLRIIAQPGETYEVGTLLAKIEQ